MVGRHLLNAVSVSFRPALLGPKLAVVLRHFKIEVETMLGLAASRFCAGCATVGFSISDHERPQRGNEFAQLLMHCLELFQGISGLSIAFVCIRSGILANRILDECAKKLPELYTFEVSNGIEFFHMMLPQPDGHGNER